MGRWRKVGVVRLSQSGKVVLLAVDEREPYNWVVVDLEELLAVINKRKREANIYCGS